MANEDNVELIIKRLKKRYKDEMHTFLEYKNAWQLLVATILSAQAKDAHVNKITKKLFEKYPNVEDYIKLKEEDLYKYIKSVGLYRSKTKNILRSAKQIVNDYNGEVPNSLNELIKLNGVGRKTANVVLANYFGKNEGIAIDTHCITVSRRLFLFKARDPKKLEIKLMRIVPRKEWGNITHLFIALGRDTCTARKKYCEHCVLNDICPSSTLKIKNKSI